MFIKKTLAYGLQQMISQTKGGSITVPYLLFDLFGISCMTTDNFCFYLQNRQNQTSQTGGHLYSDTSPFSIPWLSTCQIIWCMNALKVHFTLSLFLYVLCVFAIISMMETVCKENQMKFYLSFLILPAKP